MRPVVMFACVLVLTSADRAYVQASFARGPSIPIAWLAPTGHFQPRARDVPTGIHLAPSLEEQQALDRALDEKLKICRGC